MDLQGFFTIRQAVSPQELSERLSAGPVKRQERMSPGALEAAADLASSRAAERQDRQQPVAASQHPCDASPASDGEAVARSDARD